MSEKDLVEVTREIGKEIREFAKKISEVLNMRLEKILDALNLARAAEIIDIKIENNEIIGIRARVPSESRPGHYYYVTVGYYGYKCNCEATMYRGRICKHVLAVLMLWNVINVFKTGKALDVYRIRWLYDRRQQNTERKSEGELREDSPDI
ncbi:MAG: SWIM zinc finger family protein [Crenarchaeota archaeon]|nr:SWIM zinc finger family protein [Thermoproteota archaeon]